AAYVASGRRFLARLSAWLAEFGVTTQNIYHEPAPEGREGEYSDRLRLVLSSTSENLLTLWTRVGYEYNRERAGLAALAVQYLKHKQKHLARRTAAVETIRTLAAQGMARKAITSLVVDDVDPSFVARALGTNDPFVPRVGEGFPTFEEFCTDA